MNQAQPQTYDTKDLFLAAFLVSNGHQIQEILRERKAKKCTFRLDYNESTTSQIKSYYNNAKVNVLDFKRSMEALRAMIREKSVGQVQTTGLSYQDFSNWKDVEDKETPKHDMSS